MNRAVKILFVILILLVAFAAIITLTQDKDPFLNENTTILGSNSNGTVYKMVCGNNSSSDTAIVILGVHSLESGIHNATYEALLNFTQDHSLNRKYIVYFIQLNFKDSGMNTSDYNTNRHMGELLAHDYVVPDIENYSPYVVVDVHEMEDYWDLQRYVGVLDNKSDVEREYAKEIGGNINYPVYPIRGGTSPEWVTIPVSQKHHNTILFETAQADTQYNKTLTAIELVRAIDRLTVY